MNFGANWNPGFACNTVSYNFELEIILSNSKVVKIWIFRWKSSSYFILNFRVKNRKSFAESSNLDYFWKVVIKMSSKL